MKKLIGNLALLMAISSPAFGSPGDQYSCSFEKSEFDFTLKLSYPLRVPNTGIASIKAEEGVNVGLYTYHTINEMTRLAGATSYNIQTSGSLGQLNLSLVGYDPHIFGHGTLDGVTILGDCKKLP